MSAAQHDLFVVIKEELDAGTAVTIIRNLVTEAIAEWEAEQDDEHEDEDENEE